MQFSTSLIALTALAVGQATAGTLNHRHFHTPGSAEASPAQVEKRALLSPSVTSFLQGAGFKLLGANSATPNGNAWLGNDGPYTNDFTNNSTDTIILFVWSKTESFVSASQPLITVPIAPGAVQTVSFASGASGGWAPVYPDTKLSPYGQVDQTWGEYTFADQWSTVDVSREVNMSGKPMKIVTPQCVSDMETCVFKCTGGANTCMTGYTLENCAAGSQPGAQVGTYAGAASGGRSGMGNSAKLTTYFM